MAFEHGGAIIAERLSRYGIDYLFTLCGGHISPILTAAKSRGIKVVDVRDEVSAVFAADAVARMTGKVGVAAVTAGPGVTNTVTAIKNAQMAQSPIVLIGGAAATVLKGRGSLQDIDQISLMKPITKWATACKTVGDLGPTIERAIALAADGVPGPVFIEVPIDLLYPEELVREWFMKESGVQGARSITGRLTKAYLTAHLFRQFHVPHIPVGMPALSDAPSNEERGAQAAQLDEALDALRAAKRPVLILGSQALANFTPERAKELADCVHDLGVPTYLGGTARGLLGKDNEVQFRHARGKALKEADLVLVAGFPFDFRLGYGRSFGKKTKVISANLSAEDLKKNRKPDLGLLMHPGEFVMQLSKSHGGGADWDAWFDTLTERENARDAEITEQAQEKTELVNSLHFCQRLEEKMSDDAVIVVDGGDFVATAAYIVKPRSPLSWLDPGVFGTLGVGGGFAVGAALARKDAQVWIIYGDGSSAYSLAEFDTCVRHGLAPIAIIGNDGAWAQIARDQVDILQDDVATTLLRSEYHKVAEGYGGVGILVTKHSQIDKALDQAIELSKQGKPVLINVHITPNEFRKGSISM